MRSKPVVLQSRKSSESLNNFFFFEEKFLPPYLDLDLDLQRYLLLVLTNSKC